MKNLIWILLSICPFLLQAQTAYHIPTDSIPTINITGTSTLHGWTAAASTITNYPESIQLSLDEGATIDSFAFSVAVKSLDGGRGASMNGKIFNALQAEAHPEIHYQQTLPAVITKGEDGQFSLTSTGALTMAGATKEVAVEVAITEKEAGQIVLQGSKDLKMSDFAIEPPSAMFGQIQTNDAITVNFEFVYWKNN